MLPHTYMAYALLIVAGALLFACMHHFTLGVMREKIDLGNIFFAMLCLFGIVCDLGLIILTRAQSVEQALLGIRLNDAGAAAAFVGLLWFAHVYARPLARWQLWGLSGACFFAAVAMFATPYSLRYVSAPTLQAYTLPWGEVVVITSKSNNPLYALVLLPALFVILLAFQSFFKEYRRQPSRFTLAMVAAMTAQVLAVFHALLLRLGILNGVPMGLIVLLLVILVMSAVITARLRRQTRGYLDIIDHVPAGIALLDRDRKTVLRNRYWSEVLPAITPQHISPPRKPSEIPGSTFPAAPEDHGEIEVQIDGKQRTFLKLQFPMRDEDGDIRAECSILTDITSRKQAESSLLQYRNHLETLVEERTAELSKRTLELEHAMQQLVQSEKLAALGGLVAGVAHELNTPLGNALVIGTSLQGDLNLITEKSQTGQMRRSDLDTFFSLSADSISLFLRNTQRAAELVSSFKKLAVDQSSTRRREFGLDELVRDTLDTLVHTLKGSNIQIHRSIAPELTMDSFPGPLEQIITNLVQNAIVHAMVPSRPLTVSISAELRPDANPPEMLLIFEDDGAGMEPQVVKQAFDPYFSTRFGQGGSGLGLYIVHNLITAVLGGTVTLESTPDHGARFALHLPVVAPELAKPAP